MNAQELSKYAGKHLINNVDVELTQGLVADVVRNMLSSTKGVTFAGITQATRVKTSAFNSARVIVKVSKASIILANNLNEFTNVYRNKVEKEVGEDFQLSANWFNHTDDCYSIVEHAKKGSLYLYAIYNNTSDTGYYDADNGVVMSKQEVAELMTPSAAAKLLDDTSTTYNKTNDVTHSVTVRTIGLENVVELRAEGEAL